jgi:hypothetical protein
VAPFRARGPELSPNAHRSDGGLEIPSGGSRTLLCLPDPRSDWFSTSSSPTGLRPTTSLALTGILGLLGLVLTLLIIDAVPTPSRPNAPDTTRTAGVTWTGPIDVATGKAYRGPWRMNASDWRFVDDPTVALSENGTAGVVWTDHVEQDLFFQAYGPDGDRRLASPVNVSQNPDTFSWLPRMVFPTGSPDTVYVLWQEIIFSGGTHGGETLFARSVDGGRTFSDPINLSQSVAGDGKGRLTEKLWHNGSLDLAVGPEGTVYAAWTEYEGRLWLSRSTDEGASFSEPVHVTGTNERPARAPSLAVDSAGTVHLAWAVGEDPSADIRYAQSGKTGTAFGSPQVVSRSEGHADAPSLAVDLAGTVHLAYGESPAGPFQQYHVRYTHSPTGVDSFAASTTISTRQPAPYVEAHFPTLRAQSTGTLHVLWELYPKGSNRSHALAYASSQDGGDTFAAPSVVPGTADPTHGFNGSQQGLLMEKIAINGAGELAVVNSTFDRGNASHVWLYRGQTTDP